MDVKFLAYKESSSLLDFLASIHTLLALCLLILELQLRIIGGYRLSETLEVELNNNLKSILRN